MYQVYNTDGKNASITESEPVKYKKIRQESTATHFVLGSDKINQHRPIVESMSDPMIARNNDSASTRMAQESK